MSFSNSFIKLLMYISDSFSSNKKFLHTIYFSEFANLLVNGLVMYTSEYTRVKIYKISIVNLEKISNILRTKCPPLFCIVIAYTTSDTISLLTSSSCLLKSFDTSIPPSAVIICIECLNLLTQYV